MYCYLLLLISLHQTCGVYLERLPFGGSNYSVEYTRDVVTTEINSKISSIQDKIIRIMEKAESDNGISFFDLKSTAQDLKESTHSVLSKINHDVSEEEVNKLLNEVAASSKVIGTFSHWIMDINFVTSGAHSLNVTLKVLQKLSKLFNSQQAAGENFATTLAAINRACDLMINILQISEKVVISLFKHGQNRKYLFRRDLTGSVDVGYDKANGVGVYAGVQYSKENIQANVNGGWNERQGANINAGLIYSKGDFHVDISGGADERNGVNVKAGIGGKF